MLGFLKLPKRIRSFLATVLAFSGFSTVARNMILAAPRISESVLSAGLPRVVCTIVRDAASRMP